MTKAEAHEVYNMNCAGQDPRLLNDEDFSNEDWLQVFTEVPKRGNKVKCRFVKKEFWSKFYSMFTSVYQEPPGNYGMEVTKAFAKGFLYEHLRGAVNWTAFAESVVVNMESSKLQLKKQRWAAFHSSIAPQSSRHMTMVSNVDDGDASKDSCLLNVAKFPRLGIFSLDELDNVGMAVALSQANALTHYQEACKKEIARVFKLEMTVETLQAEVVNNDCSSEVLEINREIAMMDEIIPILNARVAFVNDMKRNKSRVRLQVPVPKVPPPNAEMSQVPDSCNAYAIKGDLNLEVISKEFEGGATISARLDKEETNCNLEDVHDVEEIQTMDDDVLPIAHEILAESELVRDEVELSKSHNPSKPLMSIPVNEEKSPSKSPCIAKAFAAARNARKGKVISGGARGDHNERLDAANGSESAKEKDFVVVAGDTKELEPLGCSSWRWVKPVELKGVLKIMSTLRRIGVAHKVRIVKELVLVIQSLAIFPAVQSDEYDDSGVVPQEPIVGLGANDDAGGDAPEKEGTASGWTRWKDV
ncbi:hypothetical protein L7F22_066675 [Adiantum nelumboides]|nr:hypothetical protein [Adiantum nelumboides]